MTDFSRYFRRARNVIELQPGVQLFAQGEPGETMYAVLEGAVAIRVGDTTIDHAGPGELIGEMALVEDSPRSASAVAASACRLAVVDRREFVYMVHESPTFALDVMREMAERLRRWHARTAGD